MPLSSSCYAHRITHIYHLLLICSPSSSDILQPPWGGGCSVVYFKRQSVFLLRCLHQPELLFFVQPQWGGVPLFASTRVIVYRSVSLQLGRAAPLIIQHAVLRLLLRITINTDFCIADSLHTHCGVFVSAHLHTDCTQWVVKLQLYLCAPCSCQNPEAIGDTVLLFTTSINRRSFFPNQNYSISLWNGSVSSCWAALKKSNRACVSIHYHISYHCLLMTRKPSQCPPIHIKVLDWEGA